MPERDSEPQPRRERKRSISPWSAQSPSWWTSSVIAPLIVATVIAFGGQVASFLVLRSDVQHLAQDLEEHESRGGHEPIQRQVDRLSERVAGLQAQQAVEDRALERRLISIETTVQTILRALPQDAVRRAHRDRR